MQAVLFLHGETDLGKKLYSQQRLSNLKWKVQFSADIKSMGTIYEELLQGANVFMHLQANKIL
jgi:hypothetical protein